MSTTGGPDGGEPDGGDPTSPETVERPPCLCWPDREHDDGRRVHERLTAEPTAVRTLRRRMRSWLDTLELDEELAESVVLAVDEAVTNAVEHACPDWDCHVELLAAPRGCGGGFAVLVADNGTWQEPDDPGYRGRGVRLIKQLSHRSTIEAGEQGTTVRVCWTHP